MSVISDAERERRKRMVILTCQPEVDFLVDLEAGRVHEVHVQWDGMRGEWSAMRNDDELSSVSPELQRRAEAIVEDEPHPDRAWPKVLWGW